MSTETNIKDGFRIYEIGYIIVPTVPEEKVTGEVSSITSLITDHKGEVIGSESAEKKALAYEMIKKIGTTNHRFKEGYFGWVKFEMPQDEIAKVKVSLDANKNVLRFLLINTIRENTYLGENAKSLVRELEGVVLGTEDGVKVAEVIVAPASPEAIDKSIDDMVKKSE
ncbi:MAG: 30S ribosomal protein S6 [bacterium]|nr:30S ribosomal protein S6 [bacterium]